MEWDDQAILSKRGTIKCDSPNEYLDAWEGSLLIDNQTFSCKYIKIFIQRK